MTDNTTELDFGTTAQKATDAEKLPVVLLALDQGRYDMARSLDELRALADANGMDAVAKVVQKRATPEAATLLGEGKVAEARLVCQNVNAAAAIFDGELTGSQIRNLSAALQVEVLDRTMLILEIFRARATTNEGKLQTELATLRYQLPRLGDLALTQHRGGPGRGALLYDLGHGVHAVGIGQCAQLVQTAGHIIAALIQCQQHHGQLFAVGGLLGGRAKVKFCCVIAHNSSFSRW